MNTNPTPELGPGKRKHSFTAFLLLMLVSLCGCFEVDEELHIAADGSGSVRLQIKTAIPEDADLGEIRGQMQGFAFPPLEEQSAKQLFPAKDFLVKTKRARTNDQTLLTVEATFKNINALLASPYGRAHALSLQNANGRLTLKALTGLEGLARLSGMSNEFVKELGADFEKVDLQKDVLKARAQFRIVLPNPISDATGARDAKSATWSFERSKFKNAAEFAEQLGTVLETSCTSDGIKFSPLTPPRLALQRFEALQETVFTEKGASRDSNQIAAAVKFVPYSLNVTRTLDLSGEGSRQDQAVLIGAMTVPAALAPQQWGEPMLDQVLDPKGRNLKDNQSRGRRMYMNNSWTREPDDQEQAVPDATSSGNNESSSQNWTVTFNFQPPDWQVKEIASLKGSIPMTFFGGKHLLKLTNSVPAGLVREMKPGADFDGPEPPQKFLAHPKFKELGLSFALQTGLRMGELTTLMFQTETKNSAVSEVQVFDKNGKPWPTLLTPQNTGGENVIQVAIAGRPPAPLSLALLVNGGGMTVPAPIVLEHIPLTAQRPTDDTKPNATTRSRTSRNFIQVPTGLGNMEDLPVAEAGPGFLVEALDVTIKTSHQFENGKPRKQTGAMYGQMPGLTVRARLFAPKGRTMQSVSGIRVLKAIDDKGRAVSFGSDDRDLPGSVQYNSGGRDMSSSYMELRLGLPKPDALSVDKLIGEAVASTVGKWKSLTLTNVHENPTNQLDLSPVLAGAKLAITKASSTNQQISIQVKISGPDTISQLNLQCKSPGFEGFNSWSNDENFSKEAGGATRTINIQCNSFSPGAEERVGLDSVVLVVRFPEDLRRERVEFTLTGLDLF